MKFSDIDKVVLETLKARMQNEIADFVEDYCDKHNIVIDTITEDVFDDITDDYYSNTWVEFLDAYNTEALYTIKYNEKDGIVVDFEEV